MKNFFKMAGFITVILLTGIIFAEIPVNYDFKIEAQQKRITLAP